MPIHPVHVIEKTGRTTTQRNNSIRLSGQGLQVLLFQCPETRLALAGKNGSHTLLFAGDYQLVQVNERSGKIAGQLLPQAGFTAAHKSK